MHSIVVSHLYVYPIKSCAGIALARARLTRWGLEHDRSWMVVDANGTFLTQRRHPRLALVQPRMLDAVLQVSAPGMPLLELPLAASDYRSAQASQVRVWEDQLLALDAGEVAARWFEQFLGTPARLVRFDPQMQRVVDRDWTGAVHALTQFSDGFPILLFSEASLEDLNARLVQRGRAAVPLQRFRPNVVVTGLAAYAEDGIERVEFTATGATLALVKPCKRCVTTTVDPASGARDARWPSEPLETLVGFRMNSQLKGATFGQNALILCGEGSWLEVGQGAHGSLRDSQ